MNRNVVTFRSNAELARQLWGEPSRLALRGLRELTIKYSLSVAAGDLQFLDGRWYVTHSGLLQLASRKGCRGIRTILQERLSSSRRRNACCRNASCQPGAPKSLWNRALQRRRARVVLGSAKASRSYTAFQSSSRIERLEQRPATIA